MNIDSSYIISYNSLGDELSINNDTTNGPHIVLAANDSTTIRASGITTPQVTQTSLASKKKNFEKMQDNALDIINRIDIYKYNLKSEEDTEKKHLGFVIGEKYNYSKEVTSTDNTGVDNYSFTSLCCKAIQELDKRISILEGSE